MTCQHCQADVPEKSKFCNMCGGKMESSAGNGAGQTSAAVSPASPSPVTSKASVENKPKRPPTREERVQACLEKILKDQDLPAFSHHISKVMGVIGNEELSLRHLNNIILRDYSLSLAVLRRANSAYYNRSNRQICSVAHAITLLGIEAVRSLAATLILFEHYNKRAGGLKELLLLSLLTASHARQAAAQIRLPRAEEAYLCGMFRNLGEVLVATHLRKQYSRILKERGNSSSETKVCLQVLGFTYEDLGQGMARHWHMPKSVTESMGSAGLSPTQRAGKDIMETLVAFSHELTDVIYRRNPDNRQAAVALIVDKYGSSLRLGPDGVQVLIAAAVSETMETFAAAKIPLDSLQLRSQAEAALQGGSLETGAPEPEEEAATQAGRAEENLLDSLAAEVDAAMQPGASVQMNSILMMVLEACHRGAGFDRVIFFLADSDRTRLRGRLGLGEDIESMIDRLEIPLAGRSEPLTGLLTGGKATFADVPGNPAYQDSKVLQILRPRSFGLFPVVVDGSVVGCLYIDRLKPETPPSPRVLKLLKRLRDHMAEAIRRTRVASESVTVAD